MEIALNCKCLKIRTKLIFTFIYGYMGRKIAEELVLGYNNLQIDHLSIFKQPSILEAI